MLLEHTSVTTTTAMARGSSPRGEHWDGDALSGVQSGSSPHARGTLHAEARREGGGRFIPARAGNTAVVFRSVGVHTVHPRTRGEHVPSMIMTMVALGSSPHARGTRDGARHRRAH